MPAQMSRPAVTLVKGTEHHEFFLYDYNQDGGRLHKGTILEDLTLATVKFRFGGDSKFGSIPFDSNGLSLDRFPAGATIEVSGEGEWMTWWCDDATEQHPTHTAS